MESPLFLSDLLTSREPGGERTREPLDVPWLQLASTLAPPIGGFEKGSLRPQFQYGPKPEFRHGHSRPLDGQRHGWDAGGEPPRLHGPADAEHRKVEREPGFLGGRHAITGRVIVPIHQMAEGGRAVGSGGGGSRRAGSAGVRAGGFGRRPAARPDTGPGGPVNPPARTPALRGGSSRLRKIAACISLPKAGPGPREGGQAPVHGEIRQIPRDFAKFRGFSGNSAGPWEKPTGWSGNSAGPWEKPAGWSGNSVGSSANSVGSPPKPVG